MITFLLCCFFSVSTNAKLLFSRVDGGVQRRGLGCQWPFFFCADPEPDTMQRKAADIDLKNNAAIARYVPGLYYLMQIVFTTFYSSGIHKTPGPMPASIKQATEELCREELRTCVEEILKDDFTAVTGDENGLTWFKIRSWIFKHDDIKSMHPDSGAFDAVLAYLLDSKKVRGIDVYEY